MFIKIISNKLLTTQIYSNFGLLKKPVKKYFNNNFQTARNQINEISLSLNIDKKICRRYFRIYPKIFLPNS
jgi:hypothetical protein